jgi:hypothetical protein
VYAERKKKIPELKDLVKRGCAGAKREHGCCRDFSEAANFIEEADIYMGMHIFLQISFLNADRQTNLDPLFSNSGRVATGNISILM